MKKNRNPSRKNTAGQKKVIPYMCVYLIKKKRREYKFIVPSTHDRYVYGCVGFGSINMYVYYLLEMNNHFFE